MKLIGALDAVKTKLSNIKFGTLCFAIALTLCIASLPCTASGPLVIVGGNLSDDNKEIYDKFIDLAGGNNARVGIISAASRLNYYKNQQSYIEIFAQYGIHAEWIEIYINKPDAAQTEEILTQIKSLTGIFIGGGDQTLLKRLLTINVVKDSRALKLIRDKHKLGMPIGGTSAGAVVMSGLSHVMITGGWPHKSLLYNAAPSAQNLESGRLTYNPDGGFGFFPYGILDTHLSARKRQGRLIRLASDMHSRFGFGIDEDTSMVMEESEPGKPMLTVYGINGVYIVDLLNAKTGVDAVGNWTISNVKNHYLKHGDQFNPKTGAALLNSNVKSTFPVVDDIIDFSKGYPYQIVRCLDSESVVSTTGAVTNSSVSIFHKSNSRTNKCSDNTARFSGRR